jgi:2-polyprenyl-3-methyl-5-hydroxy-6-metoxy-1,4-benzoquinol methylase
MPHGAHRPVLPYADGQQQLMELSLATPEAITTQAAILPDLLLAYRKHIRLYRGRTMRDDNESSINLEDAYALETPDDNRALYRNWASTYDADFALRNKYVYPKSIATICASLVDASSPLTILDIGCGNGYISNYLSAHCKEIICIDHNPLSIDIAKLYIKRKNITFICGDVFEINKKTNVGKIDLIVCSHIIEHLSNPFFFLKKIKKIKFSYLY